MMDRRSTGRVRLLAFVVTTLSLCGLCSKVSAGAPFAGHQVPGYYRMMLGQFEVTALSDGFIELESSLLKNAPAGDIVALLGRGFADTAKFHTSVNAFVINTGASLVMVDAGAGNVFGPTLGNVMPNLKASGYDPSQVDAVIITHMHGDHIGGLLTSDGKAAYPNATVYVARTESDFWLSPEKAAQAPADNKGAFKMAHTLADPLIAAGKWKTFTDGSDLFPGIKVVLSPGHTPGHATVEITSGGKSMWIVGDLVHCAAVQFPRPDIAMDFDSDQGQAVLTRQALFKRAAERKVFLAGAHLSFPGIGRIRAESSGGYAWVPVEFGAIENVPQAAGYKK